MKNNRGLSLVELIIAFALLAIVGVAANGLLGSGSRLFKNSTQELDLQQEAQAAFNHLNNLIIDTQRGMNYDDTNPDEKLLTIFNNTNIYYIKYKKADKCVYYSEHKLEDNSAIVSDVELISGVDDFSADITEVVNKGKMEITIKLVNSGRSFEGKQVYSLRNNIRTGTNADEVKQDVAVDLGSEVEQVIISGPTYCAKGESHDFVASVTGKNYPISAVKWFVSGTPKHDETKFDGNTGSLMISADETATQLEVKAVSEGKDKDGNQVEATKTIYIVELANIEPKYEEKNALVGNILSVTGIPTIQNGSVGNEVFQINFRLPTAEDVEKDQEKVTPIGLRTYKGINVVKSSTANACYLYLTKQMEEDEYIQKAFEQDGQAVIYLIMTCPALSASKEFVGAVTVKPANIRDVDINGNLTVNRGSTSSLSAKVNTQGIDNRDIITKWTITKDAGLGDKISIDENKGILTVSKNIDYNKEFKIEVTATATTEDSLNEMKNTVTVVIPKVSISLPIETISINKGESNRFAFMVNGLEVEAGDVICTSKPSLKNTLLYCTKQECVISIGKRETKDIAAINVMLKDDTSISKGINLYILSEVKLYNVEGRKNVYAEYFTPEQVGNGKEVKLDADTKLIYSVENQKTVLTIGKTKYDYRELIEAKKGIKEWWIPRSNVEGRDLYIPVPGLSPDLPDEITTTYMLYYNAEISLTYSYGTDRKTYVEMLNEDGTVEKFYLSDESWKVAN